MPPRAGPAATDEVVLPCPDLDDAVELLTTRLGFRLDLIMPADDPVLAVLSGHGWRLRLEERAPGDVDAVPIPSDPPLVVPDAAPTYVLTRAANATAETSGRAGMRYRDVLPGRQGGRLVASHITIPDGGPVRDQVHHHRIRFQVIVCLRGWVSVVYGGQGPPLRMEPGDCVLQPPGIRHRVLESSPALSVLEVTSPAEHATLVDHDLQLPDGSTGDDRVFEGQRFVHHRAIDGRWEPWRAEGFAARDTGIGAATAGLAGVQAVRATRAGAASGELVHDGELLLWYVTAGAAVLLVDGRPEPLAVDDAVAIPAGLRHALSGCTEDFALVEVSFPAGR